MIRPLWGSRALAVSGATVSEIAASARVAQLGSAAIRALSDAELDASLYPKPDDAVEGPMPDPATLDIELRKTGVVLRRQTMLVDSGSVGSLLT